MKELIIYIIITVACLLWAAGLEISFKPFSIKFNSLWYGIGLTLTSIGLIIILLASYENGKKAGIKISMNALDEALKDIKDSK